MTGEKLAIFPDEIDRIEPAIRRSHCNTHFSAGLGKKYVRTAAGVVVNHVLRSFLFITSTILLFCNVCIAQNTFRIGVLRNDSSVLTIADSVVKIAFEEACYEATTVVEVEAYDTLGNHFLLVYCWQQLAGPITVFFKLRTEIDHDIPYVALVYEDRQGRFYSLRRFIDNIRAQL